MNGVLGTVVQRIVRPSPVGRTLFERRCVEVDEQSVARVDEMPEREDFDIQSVDLTRFDRRRLTQGVVGAGDISGLVVPGSVLVEFAMARADHPPAVGR